VGLTGVPLTTPFVVIECVYVSCFVCRVKVTADVGAFAVLVADVLAGVVFLVSVSVVLCCSGVCVVLIGPRARRRLLLGGVMRERLHDRTASLSRR
jgi:hypothetical protein